MEHIILETKREGYTVGQCGSTMTVQELIDFLSQFDENDEVYFSNDNGYTFGSINSNDIQEIDDDMEDGPNE